MMGLEEKEEGEREGGYRDRAGGRGERREREGRERGERGEREGEGEWKGEKERGLEEREKGER